MESRSTASLAIGCLVLIVLADVAAVVLGAYQYSLLTTLAGGEWVDEAKILHYTDLYAISGMVQLVFYGVIAVVFCIWFYGVYEDLPALGVTQLTTSPGGAVASFFIPIVNLVRPYKLMKETWRASAPEGEAKGSAIVALWWIAFVGAFLVVLIGEAAPEMVENSNLQGRIATAVIIAGDVLSAMAAIFAVFLIRGVERRQARRYQQSQEQKKKCG